jgi:hypothetical protein
MYREASCGALDELAVYDRALDPNEIELHRALGAN